MVHWSMNQMVNGSLTFAGTGGFLGLGVAADVCGISGDEGQ